ncbi:MAG: hypothetical protein Q7J57_10545, partial [Gemmobacter sp.]|nr:hypothetical protein [Gemmobacter sp.]
MTFDRSTVSAIDTGLRRVLTLGAASVQRLFGLTRLVRHATTGDTDAPAPLDAPQRQTSPLAPALASTDPVSPTRPALR